MTTLTIGLAEAKANFSKLTAEVHESGQPVTVLKHNKPWVVIMPTNGVDQSALDIANDFMEEYADVFEELAK